jgi:hypothetical protein
MIVSQGVQWKRTPEPKVVILCPKSEARFSLNEFILCDLQEFAVTSMFTIQSERGRGTNIKFVLKRPKAGEPDVYRLSVKEFMRPIQKLGKRRNRFA